jgi:hypothetical protein
MAVLWDVAPCHQGEDGGSNTPETSSISTSLHVQHARRQLASHLPTRRRETMKSRLVINLTNIYYRERDKMESKPRNTWFFVRRLKGILYDVLSNEM